MTDQATIYPERDKKDYLLNNKIQNHNHKQPYMLPLNMNTQIQNNSTPDQTYNSNNLSKNTKLKFTKAKLYTPRLK